MNDISSLLKQAVVQLTQPVSDSSFQNISETPKLDAELLLAKVLQKDRTYLFTWPEKELDAEQEEAFNQLLARRVAGEPIAYILGEKDFWSLTLKVAPHTLIPRPDTETLVEWVCDLAYDNQLADQEIQVLDLGTGTGAIALALAKEFPKWKVTGVDLIPEAVALAKENQQLNNIRNAEFIQSSWFEKIAAENQFTIIVSNPPYIDKNDKHLALGDVRFEPSSALIADDQGLADIKMIAEQAKNYLTADAALLFEHGYDQGDAVRKILDTNGFCDVSTRIDLGENDRVTLGLNGGSNNNAGFL